MEIKMTESEIMEFHHLMKELNRKLDEISFSSKPIDKYITDNYVDTIIHHISYLYFYGITDYWCKQLFQFHKETQNLEKQNGKKVTNEDVYNKIISSDIYKEFASADEKYLKKYIKILPYTEEKSHPLVYNLDTDVFEFKQYELDFIDYIFKEVHQLFTKQDIKEYAEMHGCVNTGR